MVFYGELLYHLFYFVGRWGQYRQNVSNLGLSCSLQNVDLKFDCSTEIIDTQKHIKKHINMLSFTKTPLIDHRKLYFWGQSRVSNKIDWICCSCLKIELFLPIFINLWCKNINSNEASSMDGTSAVALAGWRLCWDRLYELCGRSRRPNYNNWTLDTNQLSVVNWTWTNVINISCLGMCFNSGWRAGHLSVS